MYCSNCGNQVESHSNYCNQCGHELNPIHSKRKFPIILSTVIVVLIASISFLFFMSNQVSTSPHETVETTVTEKQNIDQNSKAAIKSELTEPPKDVSEIITSSQPKVFTVLTSFGYGSGFLIDEYGHVLTNAHVVEGDIQPIIRTIDGTEYEGNVIGYSNTTDVAIIKVPALEGIPPLPLEKTDNTTIGDEVIALGSPRGYENTATLGNISGVDRTFVIPPFEYEGVYQMSAPIAPGSSGGPLISKESGKVIAINSARDNFEINIGFSIPIHQVISMIENWIASPMLEDEIYALFYYDSDLFYFNDYLDSFGYFSDDGVYDDYYYEYYEIPFDESYWDFYDWFWEDFDEEYWDWEEFDEDWYWEEFDDEYWYWDEYDDDWYWDEYDDEYWYSDEFDDEYWYWDEFDEDEYWEMEDEDYWDEYEEEWEEYDDEYWDDGYDDDLEDWE